MTHFNPVLITVLPHERRARHPYQLCIMFLLITLALSQLIVGPPANTSVHVLDAGTQDMLNWFCLGAGIGGVVTAFIPEHVVHVVGRFNFDATWLRLWVELASHMVLFSIWVAFTVIIFTVVPFVDGLTLGSAAGFWLAVASLWRAAQIFSTIHKAVFRPPAPAAIIGQDDTNLGIEPNPFKPESGGG